MGRNILLEIIFFINFVTSFEEEEVGATHED